MKILYAMSAMYPYGTPYAARVLNFCRLLNTAGHEVIVFCDYYSGGKTNLNRKEKFEGNDIYYTSEKRNTMAKATVMFRTPKRIEEYIRNNHLDLIIASSASNRFSKILHIGKKYGVPVILEINEKYHVSNWELGKLDIRYHQFMRCWNSEYKNADGFITISSFLTNHFSQFNKPIVQIPTIIDVEKCTDYLETYCYREDEIHFNFTGGLGGGKDLLGELIVGIDKHKKKKSLYVDIFGPDKVAVNKQVAEQGTSISDMTFATIYGRIPQTEVFSRIAVSDYGVILRPDRESSNAGFPTKLAEYMAVGTPVIANPTSDLAKYIVDGVNGFLVNDLGINSVEYMLGRVESIKKEDYLKMRKAARRTAIESFDFRNYVDVMNNFLLSVRSYYAK